MLGEEIRMDVAAFVIILLFACVTCQAEVRMRLHAWRNRRHHRALAEQYRLADPMRRSALAEEMMLEDRRRHRAAHKPTDDAAYPELWDYHVPKGRRGWMLVRGHQEERLREVKRSQRRAAVQKG